MHAILTDRWRRRVAVHDPVRRINRILAERLLRRIGAASYPQIARKSSAPTWWLVFFTLRSHQPAVHHGAILAILGNESREFE